MSLTDEQVDELADQVLGETTEEGEIRVRRVLARAIEQEVTKPQEPVAWRVTGNYTDVAMHDKSSAEAYCRGLLTTDPEGGYKVTPLYAAPQPCPSQLETDVEYYREQAEVMRVKCAELEAERDALAMQVAKMREALDGLIDDCIVSVDCQYGTLGTSHVRRICEAALALPSNAVERLPD